MDDRDAVATFVETVPKAELHCHLVGSIRPELLVEIARRNGIEIPYGTVAEARAALDFDGLADFIDFYNTAATVLRTPADFRDAVVDLAERSRRQSIRYRELTFSFGYYHDSVRWSDVVEGLAEGRRRASDEYGVETRYVAGIDRSNAPETGISVVERAAESRGTIPIEAIGMGGPEPGNPAHRHSEAYELADEYDFGLLAHAGEAAGPGSVWDALAALSVDRVDHGVRAIEDEILVEYLAREAVPLTVCPLSNVALGVYPSVDDHPVFELLEAGIPVTIHSDDPGLFQADLVENYRAVAAAGELGLDDVEALARASFECSYLPAERRQPYLEEIEETAAQFRADYR